MPTNAEREGGQMKQGVLRFLCDWNWHNWHTCRRPAGLGPPYYAWWAVCKRCGMVKALSEGE